MYENLNKSDRVHLIFCDIGNYRHWVKESTTPDKFFSNFDKLIAALKELTTIDYEFLEPTPSAEVNELQENEQKYYQAFLARYWAKISYEMSKSKTDKGKKNKSEKFYSSLNPYEERFSDETLNMIKSSDFNKVDVDYAHTHMSKTDHNLYFLFETDKKIRSLTSANMLCSAGCNKDDYMFYVNNKELLIQNIDHPISDEIFNDLCKLYFVYQDYRKTERYLTIKYDIEKWLAKLLSLSLNRIMCAHRDYRHFQHLYEQSPQYNNKYYISTHSAPCEKCQFHRGKIYNIKDAEIGINFPPFCSHGCSRADLYFEGSSEIKTKVLSYPDKLFAKAINLYEDGKYEEAAEYGLKACNLSPESYRYTQSVPEMLVKVGRTEEAVKILKEYLEKNEPNPHLIKDFEKYSKRLEREKKKSGK